VRLPPQLQGEQAEVDWQNRIADPESLIALDLFCGAGGMSYGFQEAGFFVAAGLDNDTDACATHAAHFLSKTRCLDLETVKDPQALMETMGIPRVDIIIGGPPCQGFSVAGRGKVRSLSTAIQEEIYARNYLYKVFVRFVEALRPSLFVMENVPHLHSFADGVIAQAIVQDFEPLDYYVYLPPYQDPVVLDAEKFGVPQIRRRLFIIGSRLGWVYRPLVPTHDGHMIPLRTLADAIADLPSVQAPALEEERCYLRRRRPELPASEDYVDLMRGSMPPPWHDVLFDHVVRPVRADDAEIFRLMKPGNRYRDVEARYRRYELKPSQRDGRYQFADRYYKLRWDQPCVTITAHLAKDGYRYIYPDHDQLRTLSVREAARVQSFPDHFRFAGFRSSRFRQIGNAVPPLLAAAIARSLARALREHRQGEVREYSPQDGQPLLPRLITPFITRRGMTAR
jgi:DNA (cytosine-5)-methyltransferase 1